MPAFTISAVNTGTDTITAVAHGLLTGDRFRVRNVGGAPPTGLTGATDVFAIRVDADNLKVATSNANALAGTPVIDITGAGSGTNTVEYGLPYCIPTALAAAMTQIKSANDQGTWNSLVALYDLLTGQAQSIFSGVTLAGPLAVVGNETIGGTLGVTGNVTAPDYKYGTRSPYVGGSEFSIDGGAPTRIGDVWTFASASTQSLVYALKLRPGTRLTDLLWSYNRSTSSLLFEIKRRSFGDGGATSSTVSAQTINSGTGWTTAAASNGGGMPLDIADGFLYTVQVTSTSAATFDGIKEIFSRP